MLRWWDEQETHLNGRWKAPEQDTLWDPRRKPMSGQPEASAKLSPHALYPLIPEECSERNIQPDQFN